MQKKWWHSLVGYQIYPKSFQDTNQDGIGDLPGVLQRLDYLKQLGVNLLWICPVYRSPMMDHGYDISDYYQIDPMFGNNEDIRCLVQEAKKRGITIIMDLVINHTSSEHPWFQEACKDPEGEYGKYYIFRKGVNGQPPNNWRSIFGGSAWEPVKDSEYYYLHLFTVGQPDLNWENEQLRRKLYDMVNYWLELGIGGFRIDAISHIKKDFSYQNQPADGPDGLYTGREYFRNVEGIEAFLQELKQETFRKYDCFTLAEVDDIREDRLEAYIGADGYYSTVFDFCHCYHNVKDGTWKGKEQELLRDVRDRVFARQIKMAGKGFYCNYHENHDMTRIIDRFLLKQHQNCYSKSMLPVLYFYLPGIPMLYQGQEIGMQDYDREAIEQYQDLPTFNQYRGMLAEGYTKEEALARINASTREQSRTPMQWDDREYAGFSAEKPWFALNPSFKECNVSEQEADPESLLSFYRKLVSLRRNPEYEEVWIYGDFTPFAQEKESLWCFFREYAGRKLAVTVNYSDAVQQVCLRGTPKTILLNNYEAADTDEDAALLQPWQAVVWEL